MINGGIGCHGLKAGPGQVSRDGNPCQPGLLGNVSKVDGGLKRISAQPTVCFRGLPSVTSLVRLLQPKRFAPFNRWCATDDEDVPHRVSRWLALVKANHGNADDLSRSPAATPALSNGRHNVATSAPSSAATPARVSLPESISSRPRATCGGVSFHGRPTFLPLRRAEAKLAFVRLLINSHPNSASGSRTCK